MKPPARRQSHTLLQGFIGMWRASSQEAAFCMQKLPRLWCKNDCEMSEETDFNKQEAAIYYHFCGLRTSNVNHFLELPENWLAAKRMALYVKNVTHKNQIFMTFV